MSTQYMSQPMPVFTFSLDSPHRFELKPAYRQRGRSIVQIEIERIIDFLEKNRSTFTPYECYHLDALIDKYESERTPQARQELKTFLIFMRRCVHPSPQIQSTESSPASSNGSATSSSTDESVTTIIEAKPKLSIPPQNGPPPKAPSQNQLSSSRHRLQHGFDRQIIPTILTDTPTGRPRHCRPICAARKERIPCSCQQCLRAKRLTAKNSSSSTDSVVTNTLKALKSVFGREKRKESDPNE